MYQLYISLVLYDSNNVVDVFSSPVYCDSEMIEDAPMA